MKLPILTIKFEARSFKKQLQSSSNNKLAGKKMWQSYLSKWPDGEKRQEEEAEVVAATQYAGLSLSFKIQLAAFAARDQIFKAGNYGRS